MISTTDDPEIRSMLEHHKQETERHEQRLRERLDALGAGTSTRKEAQTVAGALLERMAVRAGDQETAEVARRNRTDDEEMAQKIDANWDRFLDLTLAEAGIQA
jgi:ferritin-like metal-binding protein YciE